jgi:hypothetical protein
MGSHNELPFSGHCFLITGGTTAVGRACASLLASQGALILISGEDQLSLDITLQHIRNQVPGRVIGKVADLRTEEGITAFYLHGRIAFPKIDAVIINPAYDWAASGHPGVYLQCIHRAAGVLRYRKAGHIVSVLNQTTADRVKIDAVVWQDKLEDDGISLSKIVFSSAEAEVTGIAKAVSNVLEAKSYSFTPNFKDDLTG